MADPLNLHTTLAPAKTTFDEGQLLRAKLITTDVANLDVDPSVLQVTVEDPSYAQTIYVYDTDAELVKDSTAHYHVDVDLTAGGTWIIRWEATGTYQGAHERKITVEASDLQ
jgi:hypothetical protein